MADIIKTIYGKLLDWSGLANVPGALKALAGLKGSTGQIIEISGTGGDGTVSALTAVDKPAGSGATVPTKVSAFENDAGYTTEARVQELLAAFPAFKIEVVQELPAVGEEKTIYLVPFADDSGSYLEYLYVDGAWEVVGSGKDSGANVTIDSTLTKSGAAADAKTVGDRLDELEGKISAPEGGVVWHELFADPIYDGYVGEASVVVDGPAVDGYSVFERVTAGAEITIDDVTIGQGQETTLLIIPSILDSDIQVDLYKDDVYAVHMRQYIHLGATNIGSFVFNYSGTADATGINGTVSTKDFLTISGAAITASYAADAAKGYLYNRDTGGCYTASTNKNMVNYAITANKIVPVTVTGTVVVLVYPRILDEAEIISLFKQYGGVDNE